MTGVTYRRIRTSFWTDPDIRRNVREPDAKTVLLYFFTCPDSTLSGLYFQPLAYVAIHTGLAIERVRELVDRLDGRYLTYDYETEEVFVHAVWAHNVGEEWRPKDNRTKGLLRQIADTHSDRLVGALVAEYPKWEWPPEVSERAQNGSDTDPEGPQKGLPPDNHADSRTPSPPTKQRGSEATHALTLAFTHTEQPPASTTSPVAEGNAPGPRPSAAVDVENRNEVWDEIREAADRALGLCKLAPHQERSNRDLINHWRTRDRRDPYEVLAAIRGACLIRDDGTSWLKKGTAYGLAALVRSFAVVEMGDGGTKRKLWSAAVDRWREHEERGGRQSRDGPTWVSHVFDGLLDRGADEREHHP